MKKIHLFVMFLISIFILTGCQIGSYKTTFTYKCDALKDVKYSISMYPLTFITNNNEIYILSEDKFIDETNCKMVIDNVKFTDGNLVITNDNKYYEIDDYEVEEIEMYEIDLTDPMAGINYNYVYALNLINENIDFDRVTKYFEYSYIEDGILYVEDDVYYKGGKKSEYNINKEKIIDYYIDINKEKNHNSIKTDRAYYISELLNEAECRNYAEIECIYGMVEHKYLTQHYDEIAFITSVNDETIFAVMKNGKDIQLKRK